MWRLLVPKWAKAAIAGAVGAGLLFAGALAYVERERRQAAAQERLRIQAEQSRADQETRDRIGAADRSSGNANDDLDWLCKRFGIACLQLDETTTD